MITKRKPYVMADYSQLDDRTLELVKRHWRDEVSYWRYNLRNWPEAVFAYRCYDAVKTEIFKRRMK